MNPGNGPLIVASLMTASLMMGAPAAKAGVTCFGKPPTIQGTSGSDTINGTSKRDVIIGYGGRDLIRARGGNDVVCGAGGNDTILGGTGKDLLSGDGGADVVKGGGGFDQVFGGAGNDGVYGNASFDYVFGQGGMDDLFGGGAQDVLFGGTSTDLLDGGPSPFDVASYLFSENGVSGNLTTGQVMGEGVDTLVSIEGLEGSSKADDFFGSPQDDFFWDTKSGDMYNGAAGFDLVSFYSSTNPVDANLTTGEATGQGADGLLSIEALAGSSGGDSLVGDGIHNHLFGLGGNDSIDALGDDDYLHGGKGLNDDGDGGDGTDGCVAIENETSCELDTHPAAAARTTPHGKLAPIAAGTASAAALRGS
jgi:hypothetical protein